MSARSRSRSRSRERIQQPQTPHRMDRFDTTNGHSNKQHQDEKTTTSKNDKQHRDENTDDACSSDEDVVPDRPSLMAVLEHMKKRAQKAIEEKLPMKHYKIWYWQVGGYYGMDLEDGIHAQSPEEAALALRQHSGREVLSLDKDDMEMYRGDESDESVLDYTVDRVLDRLMGGNTVYMYESKPIPKLDWDMITHGNPKWHDD